MNQTENGSETKHEMEVYGDDQIAVSEAALPLWLKLTYIILPIWGILCFYLYGNGSEGWLDAGYWRQLQEAAGTTYPFNP